MSHRFEPRGNDFDRDTVADALTALSWAVRDRGMNASATRRGLEEIDTLLRGATPALDALIENYRRANSQQSEMEFSNG